MSLLAIDPGSAASGWVLLDSETGRVIAHAKVPNDVLLGRLTAGTIAPLPANGTAPEDPDFVLIEFMSPRGMPTSEHEMDALWWAGRFTQAVHPIPVVRITREEVKWVLLGKRNVKAADVAVRQVLIDRYANGGGKAAAVGLKAAPGPLFGVKADEWQALAVACAWQDGARDVVTERAERLEEKRAKAAMNAAKAAA